MSKASAAVRPLTGIRKFISVKAKHFIEGYEAMMLKRFPSTYRMIQMFTTGTKDFSSDVLQYMKTSKDLAFESRTVADLSHRELVNYMATPQALRKMTPFLLISSVPFAQYVTLPLAFWFPKQLLSRHYWNIEQRTRFAIQDHTNRLAYYRPVFRHLQSRLESIKETDDSLREQCRQVFARLGSGTHPTVSQTLALSPLFTSPSGPYELHSLSHAHLMALCKVHATSSLLPGKRSRLKKHTLFLKELDNAWKREEEAGEKSEEKTLEELRQACFLRGLNPINLTREEMIDWLNMWITISQNVKEENLSLLMHAPIFLAYNHPSNWRLIH